MTNGLPQRRVYLDNAATSWPKCSAAVAAAMEFIANCGATSGRGSYHSALLADRWLQDARRSLGQLLGAESGQAVAICQSGTHALNAGLWGLLRPGDHVITSGMEHNSLLRPLKNMELRHGIQLSIVDSDSSGWADPQQASGLLRKETKLIAVGHASNVSGRIQDVCGWSQLARRADACFLLDASQTLGYLPINVRDSGIDVLAAAGHKGLRALPGTGLLYVSEHLQSDFRPLLFGGTGQASEQLSQGAPWPQSVEVGNLNMPGIVSLAVAAAELLSQAEPKPVGQLPAAAWRAPYARLVEGLAPLPNVHLVGIDDPPQWDNHIPVLSLQVDGWDVHDFSGVLDTSFGIETRAGWHCAALVHRGLGSEAGGGTLRLSPGVSTTLEEIDYTLDAFREILGFTELAG